MAPLIPVIRTILVALTLGILLSLALAGCESDDATENAREGKSLVGPVIQPGDLVQTRILDGETDPEFPDDERVYPYYIVHHGPEAGTYPFHSGDRVPDGATVVFKAVAASELPAKLFLQGRFDAEGRINGGDAIFSFYSTYSDGGLTPGWYFRDAAVASDTISFEVGPFDYTVSMRGVAERDGLIIDTDPSPAELAFSAGFPPCVQCLELGNIFLQPDTSYEDVLADNCNDASCLDTPAELSFFITADDRYDLESVDQIVPRAGIDMEYIWVEPVLGYVRYEWPPGQGWYQIPAVSRPMVIAMHGKDHPQEHWPEGQAVQRISGWRYQVDYAADPENRLADGGGIDHIEVTSGFDVQENPGTPLSGDLYIDEETGAWGNVVDVRIPMDLLFGSEEAYWESLRSPAYFNCPEFPEGGSEAEILAWQADPAVQLAREAWRLTTLQLTPGTVRAIAVDQPRCQWNRRDSAYHVYQGTRPPSPNGRLCEQHAYDQYPSEEDPDGIIEQTMVYLENFADPSGEGEPAARDFLIEAYGYDEADPIQVDDPPGWITTPARDARRFTAHR